MKMTTDDIRCDDGTMFRTTTFEEVGLDDMLIRRMK